MSIDFEKKTESFCYWLLVAAHSTSIAPKFTFDINLINNDFVCVL